MTPLRLATCAPSCGVFSLALPNHTPTSLPHSLTLSLAVLPTIPDDQAKSMFEGGIEYLSVPSGKKYIRMVADPKVGLAQHTP